MRYIGFVAKTKFRQNLPFYRLQANLVARCNVVMRLTSFFVEVIVGMVIVVDVVVCVWIICVNVIIVKCYVS